MKSVFMGTVCPLLLAGCCLTAAPTTQWRLSGYWQPVFQFPGLTEELLRGVEWELARADTDAQEEQPEGGAATKPRTLEVLRRAARAQVDLAAELLERSFQSDLRALGWARVPLPNDPVAWQVEYTFEVFRPQFRRFSLTGFLKNLINPVPGAAILGAFPLVGGEYRLKVQVRDCRDTPLMEVFLDAEGLDAMADLSQQLYRHLAALSLRPLPECKPSGAAFMGRPYAL